jgi:ribosomal protein S18 acetylase RimI-like enzyme
MAVRLEEMTEADLPEVLQLWDGMEGVGLNESDTPERLAAYLRRNPDFSLVAREGGRIVGAVLCGHDGRRGYLHHLAVATDCRRQGLGSELIAHCLASLAAEGILKCNVFVYSDNDDGSAFWRRIGWDDRRDLKVMQRVIPSSV